MTQGQGHVGAAIGGSSGANIGASDASAVQHAGSSADASVDLSVPDGQAEARSAQTQASSTANVTGGATVESETRNAGGYQGQSVMDGGDGGIAPPDDIAGEKGAEITARNAANSDGNSLRARAGVDVDTSVASAPSSEAEVLQSGEVAARDRVSAEANVPTDEVDEAQRVYRDPSASAEAEGRSRLRAEAADRKPESVTEAEEGVATARQARDVASNPEAAATAAAAEKLREVADEKKATVQADVGVKVTTKKPDGSDS